MSPRAATQWICRASHPAGLAVPLFGAALLVLPALMVLPAPAAAQQPAPVVAFGWPLRPVPAVHTPFRPPAHPYGPGHRGVDLDGQAGQDVLAAGDGVVVFAGPLAGRGVVSVQHPNGLRTTYEPVQAVVQAGRTVRRGEPIGRLVPGHPGCAPGACLHWGVRRDREYLDPLRLVRFRVRLLPWDGEG